VKAAGQRRVHSGFMKVQDVPLRLEQIPVN